MRIQNLILSLLFFLCLTCCYPISAFHGDEGYCLWNLSEKDLIIQVAETNKIYKVNPSDYIVIERNNNSQDAILINALGVGSNKVSLDSKRGNLSKANNVVWMHLVICENGHVHEIGPQTRDFANAVIYQSNPRKDW